MKLRLKRDLMVPGISLITIHTCINTCIHIQACTRIHVYLYTCTCMNVCMICLYTCVYIHTHTSIHMSTYCVHIHMSTYTCEFKDIYVRVQGLEGSHLVQLRPMPCVALQAPFRRLGMTGSQPAWTFRCSLFLELLWRVCQDIRFGTEGSGRSPKTAKIQFRWSAASSVSPPLCTSERSAFSSDLSFHGVPQVLLCDPASKNRYASERVTVLWRQACDAKQPNSPASTWTRLELRPSIAG